MGFYAVLTGPIEYNTAIDNTQSGIVITDTEPFAFNAALGNGGPGVLVNLSPDMFDIGNLSSTATFSENAFVGNDRNRPVQLFLGSAPCAECSHLRQYAP